jgi:hypothetical protein
VTAEQCGSIRFVSIKQELRSLSQRPGVRYALSLPERVLRSASALSAGFVREVADVALPIGIRRGRLYSNLVDATLRFMIEDVGQVEGVYPTEDKLAQDFLLRRTVGNGIDVMGMLAFRASPMWVLAALADVCGVGRQLIPEIAESLKQEGLLDADDSFTNMEQLLLGLEGTAAQLADTVNTPPLDVAGLRAEWTKFVAEARRLPALKLPSPSALTNLWSDLRATAAEQDRSVFEVSSLLAVSAVGSLPRRARVLSRSAVIVVSKSGDVLSQGLLDHYRTTLGELREVGFLAYGSRQLAPYLSAALKVFAPQYGTLTEKYVEKI